jgi:hypothetical protein
MPTIDEKRVYTDAAGTETVYLGSELGVLRVTVSDAVVGEFSLVYRGSVHDIATAGPYISVAADDGVLLADHRRTSVEDGEDEPTTDELQFHNIGVGIDTATAVEFEINDSEIIALIAGDMSGGIHRLTTPLDDVFESAERTLAAWNSVDVSSSINAIDMPLVATTDGVFEVSPDAPAGVTISYVGLDSTHDVDAEAEPIAATADGLYVLANGWMSIPSIGQVSESVDIRRSSAETVRAHAVCGGSLFACHVGDTGGLVPDMGACWESVTLPITEPIVAVTHSPTATYAVTTDGTLVACVDDNSDNGNKNADEDEAEWHHRSLGVTGVVAVAVSHMYS